MLIYLLPPIDRDSSPINLGPAHARLLLLLANLVGCVFGGIIMTALRARSRSNSHVRLPVIERSGIRSGKQINGAARTAYPGLVPFEILRNQATSGVQIKTFSIELRQHTRSAAELELQGQGQPELGYAPDQFTPRPPLAGQCLS